MAITDIMDPFHAYTYGTSFWFALRGAARIYDPMMVADWFRPPRERTSVSELEIYTIKTDAINLMSLAMLVLVLSGSVPVLSPSSISKPYAQVAIVVTILHHLSQVAFTYPQWANIETYNKAMAVGVYGSAGLALLGMLVLATGLPGGARPRGSKKAA